MRRVTTLLYIVLSAVLFGSPAHRAAGADAAPFKLGVMLCLSGDCSEWGTNALKGVQLAQEEVNAAGGVLGRRVVLEVQDSKDVTPAQAVSAFRTLARDSEIHFIIGPSWTVAGLSLAPLIARRGDLVVISPSIGVNKFNEAGENIFSTWPRDEAATRALVHYALVQGWRDIALFGSQDPFCTVQSEVLQREAAARGGRIVIREDPLPSSRDLRAEALRIKNAKPHVVIVTHYQMDVVARQLRGIGYQGPFLNLLMDRERLADAQGALEGAVFARYDEPADDFIAAFRKRNGADPGNSADTAYDAMKALAYAVNRAATLQTAPVIQMLHAVKDFPGASGTFSFDAKGAVEKKPVLWQVAGGGYQRLASR